jgi:hypothetical protein
MVKKENTAVTNTMKLMRLPEGMAVVETANGRWFPARASLVEQQAHISLLEDPPPIPLALDSFHDQPSGYHCREEALAACRAWYEAAELTQAWQRLKARTELYPERTS